MGPRERCVFEQIALQVNTIGLKPFAAKLYIEKWILKITEITATAQKIKSFIDNKNLAKAIKLISSENKYPICGELMKKLGMI